MKLVDSGTVNVTVSISEMDLLDYNSKQKDSNLRDCLGFNVTFTPLGQVVDIQFRHGQKKAQYDGVHLQNMLFRAASYVSKQMTSKKATGAHNRYLRSISSHKC